MDSGIISHDECIGFDAQFGADFLDENIICIKAGNFIQICEYRENSFDTLSSIKGELTGFSAMTASPIAKSLAYSDAVQNPMIHIYDASGKETNSFTVSDVYGINDLEFSFDGEYLYSLGGLPSFRLSAFDWKTKSEVAFMTFESQPGTRISCCPMKPRLFAIYGDVEDEDGLDLPDELSDNKVAHLRFITLQGCGENFTFTQVESEIQDPVLSICWSPREHCIVGTTTGLIVVIDPSTGSIVGEPLNFSEVDSEEQNASALLCTNRYLIASGTSSFVYWFNLEDLSRAQVLEMDSPFLFMKMFPKGNTILLGLENSTLMCSELDPETHYPIDQKIFSFRYAHQGPISGVVALPHHLLTAGYDGYVRIWQYTPYLSYVTKIDCGNDKVTAIASSIGGNLVAIGTQTGLLRIINTQDASQPVLLFRERLHNVAVSAITISPYFIVSGSVNGSLVILQNDPLNVFPLIGLYQMKTTIVSLASPPPLGNAQQLLIATSHREVIRIDIPERPPDNFFITTESLNRAILKVSNKITSIYCEPQLREDQQYFYCTCDDKTVKYYCMPITTGDLDIVGVDDVESSAPDDVFSGHLKAATCVTISPNQCFVASGCAGSTLILREIDPSTAQLKNVLLTVTHHAPFNGAITGVTFSPDGRKLFTVGYDGCINSYTMKIQASPIITDQFPLPNGYFKNSISRVFEIDQQIRHLSEMWQNREYEMGNDDNGFSGDDGPGTEETPLIMQMKYERSKLQQQETEEFQASMKAQLNKIQDDFMQLVHENEDAPELEKLSETDFTLDVATAERLQQLGQIRAQLIHYRRKVKNQIRALIAQSITNRCYVPYEPKLTTIYGVKIPVQFDNFPLPQRDKKQERMLKCIQLLRRTEIAALRYKPPANDPNRVAPSMMRDTSLDGARYLSSRSNSIVTLTMEENESNDPIVKEDVKLLYDPFQIVTANRKVTQLVIVENLIYEELNKFNALFDDMLQKKVNLVQSLQEKNKRIRQLIRILKLNPDDYVIFEPEPKDNENPDAFLTVKDEEVVLKKIVEDKNKNNEVKDEIEKDSFADRALKAMMGGNINMNNMEEAADEDEPVRPEWMDTKKKEDLTEEEQYQIAEFEKKLKNFIEEREKRRKALSAELTKLVKGNAASIEEFDKLMIQSFMHRFDTEEAVFYHELEVMHLIGSLEDERNYRKQLNESQEESYSLLTKQREKTPKLQELQNLSQTMAELALSSEQSLDNIKSQIQKEFKNKDCFSQLQHLYNLVSRRIKPKIETKSPNVFMHYLQPPYVFTDDSNELQNGRPQSLADGPWKNFLEYCDRKIQYSKEAAERGNNSVELKACVKTYEDEMNEIDDKLHQLKDKQAKLTDDLLHTLVDMHIPFTFRQGQVEIPSDMVMIDYSDVLLINKKVVQDRNNLILEAGQKKLDELENIKKQRSSIKMLKWEIDKCKVELENLNEEVKEYQLFRVTKLDQELIMGGGNNRNKEMVSSLNKGLQHTQKTHEIQMQHARQNLLKLKKKVERKKAENDKIEEEILQKQLGLKERKRIYNSQMKSTEGAAEARKQRLKQVMLISRLKRGIQNQEQQIAELTDEVVKLRKGVFTSFDDGEDIDMMTGYNS
ncbi:Cilia- and flagella-associated protein 43 [Tritrichomonas musculus]|uniref:Cilia- and flagella-associated protein 43 n=1 Tax=Tritrichomonas musculus TaxID=1915356 RepID=A0ABR2KM22_9EUKA